MSIKITNHYSMLNRNYVYNVSLSTLTENQAQRIEWMSSDAHRELCTLKGKLDTDCQNYIRVFARISEQQIMLCGTNSFKPLCRYYTRVTGHSDASAENVADPSEPVAGDNEGVMLMTNEMEAQGRCPYTPNHNSTYMFTSMLGSTAHSLHRTNHKHCSFVPPQTANYTRPRWPIFRAPTI